MSSSLPPEARTAQGESAGLVSRALAASIDVVVVALASAAAVAATSVWTYLLGGLDHLHLVWPAPLTLGSLGGVVFASYLAWGWGRTGRTVGKRLLGLVVVARGGRTLPWAIAVGRACLYVIFPVGLLWCAVSSRNRSAQDLLLRTEVIYDWLPGSRRRTLRA